MDDLPAAPFQTWLKTFSLTPDELARGLNRDGATVRRWQICDFISEEKVEQAGIALSGDPRLAARLYPRFDY